MQIIFSGFDPFANAKTNPSELAVAAVPQELQLNGNDLSTTRMVLPTCCEDAWKQLRKAVGKKPKEPFLLILGGLAESRKVITLERFALNVREYRIADNAGHSWNDEYLIKSAPDAIRTHIPLTKLVKKLSKKGFACDISNHAGSFVCNETYFRSLYQWGNQENCLGIVFVHFPLPEVYMETKNGVKKRKKKDKAQTASKIVGAGVKEYADVLVEIAKFIAKDAERGAGKKVTKKGMTRGKRS